MRLLRTLLVFVTVAVAGMALLPEALAYVNAGKDPATAYAPLPAPAAKTFDVVAKRLPTACAASASGSFESTPSCRAAARL